MGTPLAPALANLYMRALEKSVIDDYPEVLHYWRYIDDYLLVFRGEDIRFNDFTSRMNQMHASIKIEFTKLDDKATFLDINIFYDINKKIWSTRIHRKGINKYLYIPFRSGHTRACLRGWVYAEVLRILRASGNGWVFREDCNFLRDKLVARGYPMQWIKTIFNRVQFVDRATHLCGNAKARIPDERPLAILRFEAQIPACKVSGIFAYELGFSPRLAWSYPPNLWRLLRRNREQEAAMTARQNGGVATLPPDPPLQ